MRFEGEEAPEQRQKILSFFLHSYRENMRDVVVVILLSRPLTLTIYLFGEVVSPCVSIQTLRYLSIYLYVFDYLFGLYTRAQFILLEPNKYGGYKDCCDGLL